MTAHSEREHAAWSASASARNFACPGALALIEALGVVDRENAAAAWGTACHQVAEKCLRSGKDAAEFIGTTETTKEHSFVFDDEMAECTQVFLDYVRGRLKEYRVAEENMNTGGCDLPATLLIEQKFDLAPFGGSIEAGGTGDAVLLFPAWEMIEIVDLKTGKGYVDAVGNKQLRTYAVGALLANPGHWETVKSTIVQPRVGGEAVRSEEIHIADLLDWTADLLDAMRRCADALIEYPADVPEDWNEAFLCPGDHCHDTYCPAAAQCPALQQRALSAALTLYDEKLRSVAEPPDPKSLPVEKIVGVLDAADMIENWLNSVRAYARELVEQGEQVGNYILVDKQARRGWTIEDEKALLVELGKATGLERGDLVVSKIKSPAQVEAAVKAKLGITKEQAAAKIAPLCPAKSSGTNLVRADKTTRAPALPPVQKLYANLIEKD